jgi:hypothetical protein
MRMAYTAQQLALRNRNSDKKKGMNSTLLVRTIVPYIQKENSIIGLWLLF